MTDLANAPRLLVEAELRPVQGERFQPTGFPSLGAATYQLHDGTEMLLVESAQSMANRLESAILEPGTVTPLPFLRGMPYVLVKQGEAALTSSLVEAHRLNSPYILEGTDKGLFERLKAELGVVAEGGVDESRLAAVLARYDIGALLHGIFLAKKELAGGRFRLRRAISAFIEARDVAPVISGGVKNDHVNPSGETSTGFGNVPFSREEYTASRITAYFNLDLAQIRSYRLPSELTQLLILLGQWKIARVLEQGLRLRTACDFEVARVTITRPDGYALPTTQTLEPQIRDLLAKCRSHFADPVVSEVRWTEGGSAKKAPKAKKGASQETGES